MSSPAYDYARNMAMEDKNIVRASIIELVLATDMKKHFGLISQFQVGLHCALLQPKVSGALHF